MISRKSEVFSSENPNESLRIGFTKAKHNVLLSLLQQISHKVVPCTNSKLREILPVNMITLMNSVTDRK